VNERGETIKEASIPEESTLSRDNVERYNWNEN
jgi:hypothetical protein